jgi:hypothetical protein
MIDEEKERKRAGAFDLGDGREILGELTIAGRKTNLYLYDKDFFPTHAIPDCFIKGILHDRTRVSLIGCTTAPVPGSASHLLQGEHYNFADVFPHYTVLGDRHVAPTDAIVTRIYFLIDDATTLFYDFDAFGHLINARPLIDELVRAHFKEFSHNEERLQAIVTGPSAQIQYYTGKGTIFSVETVLGKVSAAHHVRSNLGGPEGVFLKNTIVTTIEFEQRATFETAIDRLLTLLRYYELLVGRPQNLMDVGITVSTTQGEQSELKVNWSYAPHRERGDGDERRPHPSDVLLDAIHRPDEFCRVTAGWLANQKSRHDARMRFAGCFSEQNSYDIDRLVGAANMFDILPASALPREVDVPNELLAATTAALALFRQLPHSLERSSVMGELARVGKLKLKQKIRYRAQLVTDQLGDKFPELTIVTDEAVNCRNHYVHGAQGKFDYSDNFSMVAFFTGALEFVFAASDLIDAGWDIKEWCAHGSTMSHPFGAFRVGYVELLRKLKELLN